MDIKRDSPGVVDSISAEDIGKFPDTNLAESLQRVTGLSINRSDGEGSQVTARGIGAELNKIGRASCREREEMMVGGGSLGNRAIGGLMRSRRVVVENM